MPLNPALFICIVIIAAFVTYAACRVMIWVGLAVWYSWRNRESLAE